MIGVCDNETFSSPNKDLIQLTSLAVCAKLLYSASVLDLEIEG